MRDGLDIDLHDRQMLDEIDLVTSLMVAAATSEGVLGQPEIDSVLGLATAGPASATG